MRHNKPTVLDEVRNGLYYFDQTLFEVSSGNPPRSRGLFREKLSLKLQWEVPNFLRFGSWIGGDRDGNPNVTPEVTWETLNKQRRLVLKKYRNVLVRSNETIQSFHYKSGGKYRNYFILIEQEEDKYLTEDKKWPVQAEVYRRANLQLLLNG